MKKLLAILFCINSLFPTNLSACSCVQNDNHEQLIEESFERYPLIFVGAVIEKEGKLWLKVEEVFKGAITQGQLLIPQTEEQTSCDYLCNTKGRYLVYGGFTNEQHVYTSLCSPTRSFERPMLYPPPPPPMPGEIRSKEALDAALENYWIVEKKRLKRELEILRQKKQG